VSSGNQ